jgi:hypothetical protein
MRAASARFRAPTFWIAADRWFRTVPSESESRTAISATVPSSVDVRSTSRSRSDSGSAPSLSASTARAGSTMR